MTPQQQDYQKAAVIADKVLAAGLPLVSFETQGSWLIFRFGGPRAQTIHMDPLDADASALVAAYLRDPP